MKKGILLSLTLLLCLSLFAQEEVIQKESKTTESASWAESESMETFANRKGSHGVYIGFGGGYIGVDNLNFANAEFRIAYINDQKFEIGFGSQIFQSFESISPEGEVNQYVGGAVGGLHLKAIFFGRKKIHLSTPLFLGVGALTIFEEDHGDFFECYDPEFISTAPFFVVEPGVNVEFNINKILGFEMGARYRFSSESDFLEYDIPDMNGLVLNAMLKVGLFDFGRGKNRTVVY